jgi:hypothetical protein
MNKDYVTHNEFNRKISKLNWNVVEATSSVIIPISWDNVKEFYFRVLGHELATFGYGYFPKEFWHNDGTYGAIVNCINTNGTYISSAVFTISNKTQNSFQVNITCKNGALDTFLMGYR